MAIWLAECLYRETTGSDSKRLRMDGVYTIDLKTGETGLPYNGICSVIYGPSDVKKLARAKKISYVDCAERYFRRVGVDDSKGALFFVVKGDEERKKG